jgi:hypothetical protein
MMWKRINLSAHPQQKFIFKVKLNEHLFFKDVPHVVVLVRCGRDQTHVLINLNARN